MTTPRDLHDRDISFPTVALLAMKDTTMEVCCDICEEPIPGNAPGTICPHCAIPCQDPDCYICQHLDAYIESNPEAKQTWKEILDRSFPPA